MRIQNILMASAAILAVATAANAQNISVQNNQNTAGRVTANVTINPIVVDGLLDGRVLSAGNVYEVSAPTGQGIAEVGSNNGGISSPQVSTSAIDASLNITGTRATDANLNVTGASNVINANGVVVHNAGNRVLGQNSSGPVNSALTLTGGANNLGDLNANVGAFGNAYSGVATNSIALGDTAGAGGAFTQSSYGVENASMNFVFGGDSQTVNAQVTAGGNTGSFTAPNVSVDLKQDNNFGSQNSTLNFVQGTQSAVVGTTSFGNATSFNGGTVNANLLQANRSNQNATTDINGGAAFNGGSLTGTSMSAGNLAIADTTGSVGFSGSQFSDSSQFAQTTVNGFSSANSVFGAQSFANAAISDTNASFGSGMNQSAYGAVASNVTMNGGSFTGMTTLTGLSAGNLLQSASLGSSEGINGAANQFNGANINSLVTVNGGSFTGGLTVGATSIGNLTSVSIK